MWAHVGAVDRRCLLRAAGDRPRHCDDSATGSGTGESAPVANTIGTPELFWQAVPVSLWKAYTVFWKAVTVLHTIQTLPTRGSHDTSALVTGGGQ